jgi:hypothetical protein
MEILKKIRNYIFKLVAIAVACYIPTVIIVGLLFDLGYYDKDTNALPVFVSLFLVTTTIDFFRNIDYTRVKSIINRIRGRHNGTSKTKLA